MNKVEEVARAIRAANMKEAREGHWSDIDAGYRQLARAAIEAMKGPTEFMDSAGLDDPSADYCDRCMQSGKIRNSGWPGLVYDTMLQAALDEASE